MPLFRIVPQNGAATVTGEGYRHLTRAMRVRIGEKLEVTDGQQLYTATVTSVDSEKLVLSLGEARTAENASALSVTLVQGLPKGDKAELIVQKATELGVSEIIFFQAERSIVKLDGAKRSARAERLMKVATAAAEQCGRPSVPAVSVVGKIEDIISKLKNPLLVYEKEKAFGLTAALGKLTVPEVSFIIGPEGGISDSEAALCISEEVPSVTLGKLILRTETAAIAVAAASAFYFGALG